jgi:hypothetical protein
VGKKQALLGLDVSSSAVKLIELSRSGGRMRVESYAVEPLPVGAVVENSIADTELVGGAIKRVVAKAKTKNVAMAVAGATVITKVIQMPVGLSDAEMESQIALEADQYIPYPLDEVALDFRVLGPNPSNDNQVNVLLAGCRREQVEARTEALEIAGLKPLYIDVEAYAVERAYELAPLRTEFIQVQYSKAADIAGLLTGNSISGAAEAGDSSVLLTARGSVAVDERTNTLIVQDTAAKLQEVRDLMQVLDVPVRQVMIEARIVTAESSFSERIGVRWGAFASDNLGNSGVGASIGSGFDDGALGTATQGLNVDLVPAGAQKGAFSLGLAANDVQLNLELNALEAEGRGEVVAQPKIVTADQSPASIQQGAQIPYSTVSDGQIIIDTRKLNTTVLVGDGETIVLGGVFEETNNNDVEKVPVLGDLPLLGKLFRNKVVIEDKKELLVFITPKLINDALARR